MDQPDDRPAVEAQALDKARAFLEIQRYDLAEQACREQLVQDPEDVDVMITLGIALNSQGKHAEAEEVVCSALERNPEEERALIVLGMAQMNQGRHAAAERSILSALHLYPVDSDAYRIYGHLMYKTGHLDKAERLVRKCLELDPEDALAHSLLSVVLAERNQKSGALHHGATGLGMAPGEDESHGAMGLTYLQTGHPFKARYHLREALRIDPTEELEEAYHAADQACRWVYLPFYHFDRLAKKLPGSVVTIWIGVMLLYFAARPFPSLRGVAAVLLLGYVAFVVYTWIADPLAKAWIRLRPPS